MLNILVLDKLCRGSMVSPIIRVIPTFIIDRIITSHVPFIVEIVNVVHAFIY